MPVDKITTIPLLVWQRLSKVRRLLVEATDSAAGGADDPVLGVAAVTFTGRGPEVLDWEEAGTWESKSGPPVSFRNRLRWTLHLDENALGLSHLRQGIDHPAWLCEFVPITDVALRAREPHRCGDDTYSAQLLVEPSSLVVQWRVEGPRKNQSIIHRYS